MKIIIGILALVAAPFIWGGLVQWILNNPLIYVYPEAATITYGRAVILTFAAKALFATIAFNLNYNVGLLKKGMESGPFEEIITSSLIAPILIWAYVFLVYNALLFVL